MSRIKLSQRLRPHRRELVIAAEGIIEQAFAARGGKLPAKTQFSRLVNVCGEASCAEEIANYLRYQAGRDKKSLWSTEFVKSVIGGLDRVLAELDKRAPDQRALSETERDKTRVEAWRLYATYLTRAFTYHDAVNKDRERGARR